MNSITLIGRLGRDPELKKLDSGTTVCNFSIAVQRRFKNKQTDEYETDWFNCTAFGRTGEFIEKYFYKGSTIALTGSVQFRKYKDRDGNSRTATDVFVEAAYFTGSKSESGVYQRGDAYEEPVRDDEILPVSDPADSEHLPFDLD